jgi:hypothetical protein
MFKDIVAQLEATKTRARELRITQTDFEHWQKLYTWDAIRGISYGESFCKYFEIYDVFLMVMKHWDTADLELYIQEEYVV